MDVIRAQTTNLPAKLPTNDILATSSPLPRDCKSADPRVFITDLDEFQDNDYDADINDDYIDTISIVNSSSLPVSKTFFYKF